MPSSKRSITDESHQRCLPPTKRTRVEPAVNTFDTGCEDHHETHQPIDDDLSQNGIVQVGHGNPSNVSVDIEFEILEEGPWRGLLIQFSIQKLKVQGRYKSKL